jgi:hypothetical protein
MTVIRSRPYHRGNAIVMAMLMMATVTVIIVTLTDRIAAAPRILDISLARQQASYAAESVAAMVESNLVNRAADLSTLQTDIDRQADKWWNLKGFWGRRLNAAGTSEEFSTNGGIWFGGCLVRWTLEPVRVYGRAMADDENAPASTDYVVNTPANPGDLEYTDFRATNPQCRTNSTYYHFRIVTEAYALDPDADPTTATPWATVGQAKVMAQAQRVVQLRLTSLFRYALFYAATGPDGDIELFAGYGATMSIGGATHSNGAIYLAGGSGVVKDVTGSSNDQFTAIDGGGAKFGSAANKTTITCVDGLFRTQKTLNYQASRTPGNAIYKPQLDQSNPLHDPDAPEFNPRDIPVPGPLNARQWPDSGWPATSNSPNPYTLNGVAITPSPVNNDARASEAVRLAAFGSSLNVASPVVKTLANMPELGGRPLEAHTFAGDVPLYDRNGQDDPDNHDYTIYPLRFAGSRPVYRTALGALSCEQTGTPVSAADMPMYYQTGADPNLTDVCRLPTDPEAASTATDPRTGMSVAQLPGYYCNLSLFGGNGRTGLTIRERALSAAGPRLVVLAQDLAAARADPVPANQLDAMAYLKQFYNAVAGATYPTGPAGPVLRPPPLGDGKDYGTMGYNRVYARYMAAQYVVFLGHIAPASGLPSDRIAGCVDVTHAFFRRIMDDAAANAYGDFIAREDQFVNQRQGAFLRQFYGVTVENPWSRTPALPYMVNVLTLNIDRVQRFLRLYTYADYATAVNDATHDPAMTSSYPPFFIGKRANAVFNGLLYVARTHRGETYDPVNNPGRAESWQVNTVSKIVTHGAGTHSLPPWSDYPFLHRSGDGPPSTRMTATRIQKGSTIFWDQQMKLVRPNNTENRQEGLTICLQDAGYLQGNYNTAMDATVSPNVLPPCAIFADSMTLLSNSWVDNGKDDQIEDSWNNSYQCKNVANVNVPFDHSRYCNYDNVAKAYPPTWPPSPAPTMSPNWIYVSRASDTTYNTSFAICNVPTRAWNQSGEGSGGTHNACRFIENWRDRNFNFKGSFVVLGPSRYQWSTLGSQFYAPNFGAPGGYTSPFCTYKPPKRNLNFNVDLLTASGQPPFSPFGIETTRMVSTIALRDGG